MTPSPLHTILCCPDDKSALTLARPEQIKKLNEEISKGKLKTRNAKPVTDPIEAGLIRADKKYLYPIKNNIPVMLIEEAIAL